LLGGHGTRSPSGGTEVTEHHRNGSRGTPAERKPRTAGGTEVVERKQRNGTENPQVSGKPRSNAIPWTAFLLGAGASIAANVAHAAERNSNGTDTGAMLFAAWAPVALLLVAEM